MLTGAGVSAESGFATFRDSGGLWEQYDVQEVASIEGWYRNRALVLDFYNDRRRQLADAKPNAAHYAIAKLEKDFDVDVITQNVDNLHEKAGSTRILHLHGELTQDIPHGRSHRHRLRGSPPRRPRPERAAAPAPYRLLRRGRTEHRKGHRNRLQGRYPPDRRHLPAGLSGRRTVSLCREPGAHLYH